MLIRLIGIIVIVLIITFISTQVVIPIVRNRRSFPLFRSKNQDLADRLAEAEMRQQQARLTELELDARKAEDRANEEIERYIREKTENGTKN